MTEIEYVISRFEKCFSSYKGKTIILHGSRNYARAIIERYQSVFHFAGVISYDAVEQNNFCGLPVYQETDLTMLKPDLLILTERVKYEEAAFCALRRSCKRAGIPVFNMYGLDEFQLHRESERPPIESLKELKAKCALYECVAFETMDTLIRCPPEEERPRVAETLRELIHWLRNEGKSVLFSLRKSYPEQKQVDTLKMFGLLVDADCELIRREGEDLSFRKLREGNPGKRILYIGSGQVNEFILPRYYGIDSCRFFNWYVRCFAPAAEDAVWQEFSANRKEQIESYIEEHQLISFDIFDTLLLRKTLFPEDVFAITGKRAELEGYAVEDFAFIRKQTEWSLATPDIDQIYEKLQEEYDWSDEITERIKQLELKTERDVIAPRKEVVDLLNFAVRIGKQVVLVSDMYLPDAVLRSILKENGVLGYSRLYVSCDYKKTKQTGLYEELSDLCSAPESILHIGDNAAADGRACEAAHIHSVLLPSALRLARERGWATCVRSAETLLERCLVGAVVARLFRDPFQNPDLQKHPLKERLWRYGTGVVGPLAAGYMTWLLEKLRENDVDGVLFLARDGYVPVMIYRKLCETMPLPKPIYYYASRRAAFLGCADSEDDTEGIVDAARRKGLSGRDILKNIYHLSDGDILPQGADETMADYIDRHVSAIRQIAAESREGYRRYSKRCGMWPGGNYAVVDFMGAGTIQRYLQRYLPYRMEGYCFQNARQEETREEIEYYSSGSNLAFGKRCIEVERFFTSPEPLQDSVTKDGTVTFFQEVRTPGVLESVHLVLDAALGIAEEFFRLFYRAGETISATAVEEMYAAEEYHWAEQVVFDDCL